MKFLISPWTGLAVGIVLLVAGFATATTFPELVWGLSYSPPVWLVHVGAVSLAVGGILVGASSALVISKYS